MSRIRYQSKANGLMSLRGKWLKAAGILLLIALLVMGFEALDMAYRTACGIPVVYSDGSYNITPYSLIIEAVFTLIVLLFLPPLFIGQAEWYWGLTDAKGKGIGEVFGWFGSLKLYLKSVLLTLNIFVRFIMWFVVTCSVPIALMAADYYFYTPMPLVSGAFDSKTAIFYLLKALSSMLLLYCLFLLCFLMMRYFLAVYLLVEDNSRGVREVIRTSLRYSRGMRWEMFKFNLSFLPWFLVCYFVFPAFFVLPYYSASSSIFAKHIIYSQRAMEKTDSNKVNDVNPARSEDKPRSNNMAE